MGSEKVAASLAVDSTSLAVAENADHLPPLTEHVYTSSHHDGKRVVTLKLAARGTDPNKPGSLLASDGATGAVELSLSESANIKFISVEVCIPRVICVMLLIPSLGCRDTQGDGVF